MLKNQLKILENQCILDFWIFEYFEYLENVPNKEKSNIKWYSFT